MTTLNVPSKPFVPPPTRSRQRWRMALEKNMPMMTKRGDMMMIPKKIILIVDWLIRSRLIEKRLPDMIKNCQKNPNMVPIEPKRSPKAKGSLNPPLKFMVRKSFSGEKRTA